MPWRKTAPMEERLKLIADRLAGYSITELSVITSPYFKWRRGGVTSVDKESQKD